MKIVASCGWLLVLACFNLSLCAADLVFQPSNPPEMKPLTNHNSPAHLAAKQFRRGVNLGDYLEASWNSGISFSPEDFARIKAQGFDHIRVPVGWHQYAGAGPGFELKPEIFGKVDFVVTNALANKLAVLINIHHFNDFDRDPAGSTEKFIAIWRQVAAHYRIQPNPLAFELINEPHDAATTAAINPIYPKVIAEIRKSNPGRTIFVEPGNWGNIPELKNLVLPPDDNLIVSVHCYEPFFFTHQGASWAGADAMVTGYQFPGPPVQPLVPDPALEIKPHVRDLIAKYNTLPTENNPISAQAFKENLQYARAWSDHYGRPVHIGEFGCYIRADAESRIRYYTQFRRTAEELKLGWAMWDWSANFRYWDPQKNQPVAGMRDALFGK
ncbi:MAG: glycoside hydrolase family 5 protein [Akkermansiaceae bacterium]|nr:glycoside hydrolase family 5 protein [Verrucomicrobiales bacterium]